MAAIWRLIDNKLSNDELPEEMPGGIFVSPPPVSVWTYYTATERLSCELLHPPASSSILEPPYPATFWYKDDSSGSLRMFLIPEEVINDNGAFNGCANLNEVTIPETVNYIGPFAFANTALKEVSIPEDCEYFPTSFPEDCVVNYY